MAVQRLSTLDLPEQYVRANELYQLLSRDILDSAITFVVDV